MKKLIYFFAITIAAATFFASCEEEADLYPSELVKGAYIINYGSYGNGGASITKYDTESNIPTNDYFKNQNGNVGLSSNIQYAYEYKDSIFLMGNDADQIITVNPLFQQTQYGVSEKVEKPRHCVGYEDYLYVSCWGADADWNLMPGSYIAKFDINSNSVEKKIALPGGPEGVAIANGKLFVAMNYIDSIAVIDLATEAISYIETPAVSSYFIKDANENLYVSFLSTYGDYSEQTGLGYINTSTNEIEDIYTLSGVSTSYSSIVAANNDVSEIYIIATGDYYQNEDGDWVQDGVVYSFNVETQAYAPLIEGLSGANGVSVNPETDELYILLNTSATEAGSIAIYDADGTYKSEFACGISPYWALFLN